MKLFGYYALHSFVNQLKKLFKTWVLIFLVVCVILGGGLGLFAAKMGEKSEKLHPAEAVEEIIEDEGPDFWEQTGIEKAEMVELVAGVVVLLLLFFFAVNADKNGSKIFTPADVNLLFASPMKPQSVLMFRLMTQLGIALIACLYMLFQLPNLVLNLGLSLWAAIAFLAAWVLIILAGTLIQEFLYILSSASPRVKANLRRVVYGILLLIVAGYLLILARSGERNYLKAAAALFCGKASRFVPFWGWIKGLCGLAAEGKPVGAALCAVAVLLGCAVLIFFTWRMKVDFYEDAMARSEETAALAEKARSAKSLGEAFGGKKKKDRKDSLRRDGMKHGWGANVFFFKTMYNRFRFAHLHFFTKTMEFYIAAAAAIGLLCRFGPKTASVIPLALTLAGMTFFRTLGNPLERDTGMDFFVTIPESTWAKLFWSLMGGTADCLLDVLPAILIGSLIQGGNLLHALAWVPFIVSVDFYGTNVGVFIGLSVPVSAGKTVKQVVQILFVYFGLLPDIIVMVIGLVLGHTALAAILCAVFNLGLGFAFFGLSPIFLDPREKGGQYRMPPPKQAGSGRQTEC